MSALRAVILGCGSSGGVPRIGGHWGACDPNEPRNRRSRCSLLVERHGEGGITRVLVDTSPDMRNQLLAAGVDWVDGVLFTHDHADQTHGIDDLRSMVINRFRRIDVYMDKPTEQSLTKRFAYCFKRPKQSDYPPILNLHQIEAGQEIIIEGKGGAISTTGFIQQHGAITSLGFRFGGLAYSSDVSDLDDAAFAAIEGVKVWIVDALRYQPHPSHAHLEKSLQWLARAKTELGILTNLHVDMDYQTLKRELPPSVIPAYDGMVIEITA